MMNPLASVRQYFPTPHGWCHTTILHRRYIWSPFSFVYIKLILPQQRQMPFINIVSDHDLICGAKYIFQTCQISYSLKKVLAHLAY
jgi:hypothetical protein